MCPDFIWELPATSRISVNVPQRAHESRQSLPCLPVRTVTPVQGDTDSGSIHADTVCPSTVTSRPVRGGAGGSCDTALLTAPTAPGPRIELYMAETFCGAVFPPAHKAPFEEAPASESSRPRRGEATTKLVTFQLRGLSAGGGGGGDDTNGK